MIEECDVFELQERDTGPITRFGWMYAWKKTADGRPPMHNYALASIPQSDFTVPGRFTRLHRWLLISGKCCICLKTIHYGETSAATGTASGFTRALYWDPW